MQRPTSTSTTRPLGVLMLLAVATVAVLAFWDEQRESAAALDDFAGEQAALARSVAAELGTRLAAARRDARVITEALDEGRRPPSASTEDYASWTLRAASAPRTEAADGVVLAVPVSTDRALDLVVPTSRLLEGPARVERPMAERVLLLAPGAIGLRGTDGAPVEAPIVRRALTEGLASTWLERPDAAALGLRPRRAAVGLAELDATPLGRWGIAVVTSAERVRDRQRRAVWRLALGVLVAAGLVVAFGTAALVRQRRGLLLERELALAALARKRDTELVTASRAATLGTLAMGIAHEVSTPLGVIAGRAEQLLPRVEDDPRSLRAVQAIVDQAERIRRVIRAFLDVVRGGTPVLGDTPPGAVLDGAIALVDHRFAAAGVLLGKRVAPDLPAIHGDVPMLQQAVVNLLLNACDACSRGGSVATAADRDGDRVVFSVTDDGCGITEAEVARATEPFFTTKAPGKGSGLGLAITSEIVKLHRGELALSPASPRGTRATLSLPIPEAAAHVSA
jgi:signal transduction histidine kinase